MKMWNLITYLAMLMALFFVSCSEPSVEEIVDSDKSEAYSDAIGLSSGGSGGGNGQGNNAGIVTAGEWNDLNNWQFWNDLINGQDFAKMPSYWGIYANNRISLRLNNNGAIVSDAKIELKKGDEVVWETRTDNKGAAELWIGLSDKVNSIDLSAYDLYVENNAINNELRWIADGVIELDVNINSTASKRVELAFIVDATGSMGDEIEFLKDDLKDVIQKVKNNKPSLNIYTSTVFYRDEGDDYLVKKSGFTSDINITEKFISEQQAGGGGDFPEAVHTALKTAVNELQWSVNSRTRIAFLILDAPPHYTTKIVAEIHKQIKLAAQKGIKLIPITASGIDKETEFLMRYTSIITNGTYVFITGDSGVGNQHLEASVGEYEVELLNDLMVRLINKYTK